ncbi:phage major capsid protein [Candidatus Kaiserbacteria bacterium]|nr:phage major capsid protein [Candidatus Kaiserbacteria bacterium]
MNIDEIAKTIDQKFGDFKNSFEQINSRMNKIENSLPGDSRRPIGDNDSTSNAEKIEQRAAMIEYLRTADKSAYSKRGLQIVSPGTGGVTIQPELSSMIDDQLKTLSPFRQYCEVVQIESNSYDKIIGTGGAAASRMQETDSRIETTAPALAKVSIPLAELSALPQVTNELVSSSSFDVLSWLVNQVSEAIALAENNEVINGTGATGQMTGVLTATQSTDADSARTFGELQYLASGSAGSFDGDDLISLIYTLAPPYRRNGKFYMSTTAIEAARKLKDGQGQYLWRDPLSENLLPILAGYEVIEVPELPAVATDAVPILFADLKKGYTIADNIRHRTVLADQYTLKGWTKIFYATMSGGKVTDSNAIKLLKLSV